MFLLSPACHRPQTEASSRVRGKGDCGPFESPLYRSNKDQYGTVAKYQIQIQIQTLYRGNQMVRRLLRFQFEEPFQDFTQYIIKGELHP